MEDQFTIRTGSCQCGTVTYKLSQEPAFVGVCYCHHCQKQTSSTFSYLIGVPAEGFSLQGELQTFETVGESGGHVDRRFCGNCGSPILSWLHSDPDMIYVKAGTLEDASGLNPTVETFCDYAPDWVHVDGTERHARN